MPPLFPFTPTINPPPYLPPPNPLMVQNPYAPNSYGPNSYNAAASAAAMRAGGGAAASPFFSPLQALASGALNGFTAGQATRQQMQAQGQQAAAQASLRRQLGLDSDQTKVDVANTRAGASKYGADQHFAGTVYAANTRQSGLADESYNKILGLVGKGVGDGSLDAETAGVILDRVRGGGPAGISLSGTPGSPPADPNNNGPNNNGPNNNGPNNNGPNNGPMAAPAGPAPGFSGGILDAIRQTNAPPSAAPSTAPSLPLPGGAATPGAGSGSGFGLPAIKAMLQPPVDPTVRTSSGSPAPGGQPAAPALSLPGFNPPGLNAPGAAPPPPPNVFAGLTPGPKSLAQIAKLNADATRAAAAGTSIGNKDQIAFMKAVSLLPPEQQPGFVADYNKRSGTNYPVPGSPLPLPPGVQGPVEQVPSYTPNAADGAKIGLQEATTKYIGGAKTGLAGAQANLDNTVAGLKPQEFNLQKLTQQQRSAFQNRTLQLKQQGLSDEAAYRQSTLELGQGRLALDRQKYTNPTTGGGSPQAFQFKAQQRMTQLTAPGRADMYGNPTPGLVQFDKNGNALGPGASEYMNLMHMMKESILGGGSGAGGVAPVVPGQTPGFALRAGKSVRGVTPPAGLGPLPGFGSGPSPLRPASSGGRGAARARLLKTLGMGR